MDVFTHIKKEHEEFRKLMDEIASSKSNKKEELFKELYVKLAGHHGAEEQLIFPPVLKAVKEEDKEVVREMIEEHTLGKYQLSVIEKTSVNDDSWDAKFMVLKEVIEHHMEEEEKEFFSIARKVVPKDKAEELLDEFESIMKKKEMEKEKVLK
ncbi:MAG: hemerythrin domain-containing protein [Clostridiaceae bacterium]